MSLARAACLNGVGGRRGPREFGSLQRHVPTNVRIGKPPGPHLVTLSDYSDSVGPDAPAARHSGGAAAVPSVRPQSPRRVVHLPGPACSRRAAAGPRLRGTAVMPPAAGGRVCPALWADRHLRLYAASSVAAQLSSRAPLSITGCIAIYCL